MERIGTEDEVLNGAWLANQIHTKHPDAYRELARARLVLITRVKAMADARYDSSVVAEFLEARSALTNILLGIFELEERGTKEDSEAPEEPA